MNNYWIYLTVCLLSAATALVLTPVVKLLALKYRQLDTPSIRKVHQQPMVRLGGIAIFCATLWSVAWIWWGSEYGSLAAADAGAVKCLLLGGSGFFLIGFADDLYGLSAFRRLWMQGTVATLVWGQGLRIETLVLPGFEPVALSWLSLPLTVVWLVGVVNAINWIDGLDGLAAGICAIAAGVLVILAMMSAQPEIVYVGLALVGGLLGFWCYNYSPAEIFMGDGGAYLVGFMLGGLCVIEPQYLEKLENPFVTVLPLVVLAVPLADMVSVIVTRLYCRVSPFSADNRHFHHRLLDIGFSDREVVLIVHCLSLWTGSLALVMADVIGGWVWATLSAALLSVAVYPIGRVREIAMNNSEIANGDVWYSKSL